LQQPSEYLALLGPLLESKVLPIKECEALTAPLNWPRNSLDAMSKPGPALPATIEFASFRVEKLW
jgi:hypothetical protein